MAAWTLQCCRRTVPPLPAAAGNRPAVRYALATRQAAAAIVGGKTGPNDPGRKRGLPSTSAWGAGERSVRRRPTTRLDFREA